MEIKRVLLELTAYYLSSRQVGHTTLMKRGVSNYERKKLVLVHNMSYGRDLGVPKNETITPNSLDRLRGCDVPLAIDNGTLSEIFRTSLDAHCRLEEEKDKIKQQRDDASRLAYRRETEINTMRAQPFKTLFKTLWQRW